MGAIINKTYHEDHIPDHIPRDHTQPTFDPHFGFKSKRVERDMKISEQELMSLNIPRNRWNYCSYLLKDVITCQHKYAPFHPLFCRMEIGAFKHCKHEDYIMRMKEYEREKRLRIRQKKLEGKSVN